MKQNLLIASYDYDTSKRLAEKLAEVFSMRTLDMISLFNFDHIPNSFSDIFKLNGREYIEKKFRSILKMEFDFDNVVFVSFLGFAEKIQDLFDKIKLTNFVILLKKNIDDEIYELNNKSFLAEEEKEFFMTTKENLLKQEEIIQRGCADIVIDISNLTDEQIIDKILFEIKKYYDVN